MKKKGILKINIWRMASRVLEIFNSERHLAATGSTMSFKMIFQRKSWHLLFPVFFPTLKARAEIRAFSNKVSKDLEDWIKIRQLWLDLSSSLAKKAKAYGVAQSTSINICISDFASAESFVQSCQVFTFSAILRVDRVNLTRQSTF